MKDVMIDLETMSTRPNAAILSIGAIEFDYEKGLLGDEFYANVELSSCCSVGLHVSQSTQDWWAKEENREARDKLTSNAKPLDIALRDFVSWCGEGIRPWSNGAGFDIVILENAMRACVRPIPWNFYDVMCHRTLKNLFPQFKPARKGLKHDALADATFQAEQLMAIMEFIRPRTATVSELIRQQVEDNARRSDPRSDGIQAKEVRF